MFNPMHPDKVLELPVHEGIIRALLGYRAGKSAALLIHLSLRVLEFPNKHRYKLRSYLI